MNRNLLGPFSAIASSVDSTLLEGIPVVFLAYLKTFQEVTQR